MGHIMTNTGGLTPSRVQSHQISVKTRQWNFDLYDLKKHCKQNGDAIESPLFETRSADGRQFMWVLRFYPMGAEKCEIGDNASVQLVSLNIGQVWVKFRFAMDYDSYAYDTGPRGELFQHWGCERGPSHVDMKSLPRFSPSIEFAIYDIRCDPDKKQDTWIYGDRVEPLIRGIATIPANDNGRLILENEINDKICESNEENIEFYHDDESVSRQEDILLKFIHDNKFGDVQIKVGGKTFRAHGTLLSEQSKVLAEILNKNDKVEEKSISIDDISDRVFIEILRFIYFKEIRGIEKRAREMFTAAIKYSMHSFKEICEITMSKNVTTENAIECLELADHFELKELKKHIVEFVQKFIHLIGKRCDG